MYLLLNKNRVWAAFTVENIAGFESVNILQINRELVFPWITDLAALIVNRRAPKHREHIKKLLEKCGCNTLSGYLNISHALSLNDTLWVKRDTENISWEDISLYRHPFNTTISRMAFDGGLFGEKFTTTSPEFGTNGTFAKCWIRENKKIKLIKRGSEGFSNTGLEPYSEYYSSQILDAFHTDHVKYGLTTYKGKLASKCSLFTNEKFGLVPFMNLTNTADFGQIVSIYFKNNIGYILAEMIVADALILNQDRHLGNFGFLFDNDTGKIVKPAPLYDHNVSLLCYATDSDLSNLEEYYSRVNFGPKLYSDFISTAKELITPDIRKRLIGMKGFKFKRHNKHNLSEYRLNKLSRIVNKQIELLLK